MVLINLTNTEIESSKFFILSAFDNCDVISEFKSDVFCDFIWYSKGSFEIFPSEICNKIKNLFNSNKT